MPAKYHSPSQGTQFVGSVADFANFRPPLLGETNGSMNGSDVVCQLVNVGRLFALATSSADHHRKSLLPVSRFSHCTSSSPFCLRSLALAIAFAALAVSRCISATLVGGKPVAVLRAELSIKLTLLFVVAVNGSPPDRARLHNCAFSASYNVRGALATSMSYELGKEERDMDNGACWDIPPLSSDHQGMGFLAWSHSSPRRRVYSTLPVQVAPAETLRGKLPGVLGAVLGEDRTPEKFEMLSMPQYFGPFAGG